MPAPAACHDTALAAFAQLAALRMGARRAFITILSSNTEYVLVEATKSMSLQSDFVADPKDENWLGTSSFARADGLNDLALDEWRKARRLREPSSDDQYYYTQGVSAHWHIISDMKYAASVAGRAFFQRAPSPRFYFAIPLRDAEGTVLGSLAILDDKPRYGVSAHDMSFCEDLGDTIALHLQSSIVRSQRQRSERLIQALGVFNSGGSSLRSWWTKQNNNAANRGGRYLNSKGNDEESNARFNEEFGFEEQRPTRDTTSIAARSDAPRKVPRSTGEGNLQAAAERTKHGIAGADFSPHTARKPSSAASCSTPTPQPPPEDRKSVVPPATETGRGPAKRFDLAHAVSQSYSRASNLLREALGASGVAFVDASHISTTTTAGRRSSATPSEDNTTSGSSDPDTSDGTTGIPRMCKVTAVSSHKLTTEDHTSAFELAQRDLAKLIKAYPRAKVFSFMKNGDPYSGSDASGPGSSSDSPLSPSSSHVTTKHSRNARILQKVVGIGGSIIFYPIFDEKNERWRSALIAWSKDDTGSRFFDQNEDVTYISSFAHSLLADLARIETAASDAAKGSFISSISHELR